MQRRLAALPGHCFTQPFQQTFTEIWFLAFTDYRPPPHAATRATKS